MYLIELFTKYILFLFEVALRMISTCRNIKASNERLARIQLFAFVCPGPNILMTSWTTCIGRDVADANAIMQNNMMDLPRLRLVTLYKNN